ncbi:MAG: hypothetical protein OET57_17370 [Desulfobacteraceae bacterium]|nr:hypothetical protein [Desulfobacteraceae bacterium]MDH3838521.1 hypothetical protein [Desulfobacteraceae bacterium]
MENILGLDLKDIFKSDTIKNELIKKHIFLVNIPRPSLSNLPQTMLFQLFWILGRMGNQRAPENQTDLDSKTTQKSLHVGGGKGP